MSLNEEQEITIIGSKETASSGSDGVDDTFFWEELLSDDDKDWSEEYLGIEVKADVKS